MKYTLNAKNLLDSKADTLVIAVPESGDWTPSAEAADQQLGGQLRALVEAGDFSGKLASCLLLPLFGKQPLDKQHHWRRMLLVGTGKNPLKVSEFRKMALAAFARVKDSGAQHLQVALCEVAVADRDESWCLATLARLSAEQAYRFSHYKSESAATGNENNNENNSENNNENKASSKLTQVTFKVTSSAAALKHALKEGSAVGLGVNFCRDLGNTPPNVCNPKWLGKQAEQLVKAHDCLKVTVLDEKAMKALGMHCLLSVSAGSAEPARLIVVEYQGGHAKDKPHLLVGKGITFDTGGISLKPGEGMDEMKYDMCGAASVLGVMRALAELKPAINVVGVIASAENMPGSTATRPGDIVKTMSGQTVEILNTDAEGRLVLCDALTYVERFNPETVIDIATLTGACIIALGHQASAVMANDQALAQDLLSAGEQSGDRAWQLPIWDEYQSQLDSNFADMQNIGGRPAGSITAACFLSRFTKAYRWAHLDIAGTAWLSGKEKGATGRPVPMLMCYLLSQIKTSKGKAVAEA